MTAHVFKLDTRSRIRDKDWGIIFHFPRLRVNFLRMQRELAEDGAP